ncbi:tripartite tricarboxylate transporter substrate binding protein [Pigmentiphaga sp. H8]|uniref:Bug family tripartite tricarboxylate transporter substrate binding protein n=1 Tax=Pigmentiphaga sp. H8 TaxID=2488560 RepID=UPI00137610D7|nr:tripartite tricarboxylate transporter substrate binding protein [Pigmentiphaga sp. H8]
MKPFHHRLARYSLLLLPLAAHGAAWAQSNAYPSRPIRIVNPYGAGGLGDVSFRLIAPLMEKQLGQPLVIENKPGASGNLGAADVARAAPDGYTLLLGAVNNFATNQYLYRDMGFDPLTAFDPIALISNAPTIVVVNPAIPARSLRELAAYAKERPGKVNFGSPGIGTPPHLAAEYFANLANVSMTHVPFNGSPPVVLALLRNDVNVAFYTAGPIAGPLKAGTIQPIAVAANERLDILPNVPTTAEAGYGALQTGSWIGLAAPKGTDPAILDKLNAAVRQALADPEVRRRYADMGMLTGNTSRAQFSSLIDAEATRWKKVIADAGIAK